MATYTLKEALTITGGFEVVKYCGKPCLFSEVPLKKGAVVKSLGNLYHYSQYNIRHDIDDWGKPVTIEIGVIRNNCMGTLIFHKPFDIDSFISYGYGNLYRGVNDGDFVKTGELIHDLDGIKNFFKEVRVKEFRGDEYD